MYKKKEFRKINLRPHMLQITNQQVKSLFDYSIKKK